MDNFTRAYIECALWSSCDDADRPLDDNYDLEDLARDVRRQMIDDCEDFQIRNSVWLLACYAHRLTGMGARYDAAMAGHDFWLTRNGHGAGFWDRGLPHGNELSKAAEAYGSVNLYVGSDGKIHGG